MASTSAVISDLMTSREVADYLRLPLPTVYYLAKAGKLPSFQVGNRWRFRREEIERLRNSPAQPPKVLVVDDDPIIRELLETALTRAGTEVSVTSDPEEALQRALETEFDVLFIDLVLGPHRGVDLIRKLQNRYPLRKIVIITGHPELLETGAVLELGPMTVLLKPFHLPQVVECVGQIVGCQLPVPGSLSAPTNNKGSAPPSEPRQDAKG